MPLDNKNRSLRGLANLRTMAGRTTHFSKSYKVYLRVAILGIGKVHRSVERTHVLQRGQILNQRFREIDDEKRQLSEVMSTRDATLKELRPAHQEWLAAMRQTASRTTKEAKKRPVLCHSSRLPRPRSSAGARPKLLASINLGGNGL